MSKYDYKQLNCPNCGAPIIGDKCEYCGAMFIDTVHIDGHKPMYIKFKYEDQILIERVFLESTQISIEPSYDYRRLLVHTNTERRFILEFVGC